MDYNVEGYEAAGNPSNYKGVRALVWFPDVSYDCNRVSSLIAFRAEDDQAEWGWVRAYSSCDHTYRLEARLFRWRELPGFPTFCDVHDEFSGNVSEFRLLTLQDTNQDTWWSVYLGSGGTSVGSMNMDFSAAYLNSNGERDNPTDSAWSHFKDLQKLTPGSSTWTSYGNVQQWNDRDTGYRFRRIAADEHKVEPG